MAKQGSAREPLRERVNGSNAAAASEAATPEEAAYSEHEPPADAETEAAQVLWPSFPLTSPYACIWQHPLSQIKCQSALSVH